MPYINSTKFGEIVVNDVKYNQVLILGDKVIEREYEKLEKLFGTSHKMGNWEIKNLLRGKPEIIIIGTGQNGQLEVEKEFLSKTKENNIEAIASITPEAIKIYNEKIREGKRVNALFHTTC